jgi:signal transduction histidine kinase
MNGFLSLVGKTGLMLRQVIITATVVILSVLCSWIAVDSLGPWLFLREFRNRGVSDPMVQEVARDAYIYSALWVILTAGFIALVVSSTLVLLNSRSMLTVVSSIRRQATRIAQGNHDVWLGPSHLGAEFEALSHAFNSMAAQLREIETTRARLLGDLAHEMRTPLATLDGYLEAISDGVESADAETLAVLRQQTARLIRLASDVSLVATLEEGHLSLRRQSLTVTEVVNGACQSAVAHFAEAGVSLIRDYADGAEELTIDADADRIEQVLTNLLDNAVRHTPQGGHVFVSVAAAAEPDSTDVVIEVRDDGEGIAPEHLAHLFERFYRADSARDRGHGGSGIGLTIVKALVTAHGGSATAASAGVGQGAVFTIALPTVPALDRVRSLPA